MVELNPTNLTKVTVNLVPRAVTAMEAACTSTKDSKTDTINRALQVYQLVLELMDGRDHFVVEHPDGSKERAYLL